MHMIQTCPWTYLRIGEKSARTLKSVVEPRDELLGRLRQETEWAMAELGYASYYDFYAAVKRVDYPRFATVVADALERTNDLYERHVAPWVREEVGRPLDGLSSAHTYWLRRNQAPAHLFPKDRMAEALRGSLAAMGVNLDAQDNILIDAEDRPSKNPRACVFPARVPGEVHLIIKPTGGKGDYDAFFHEAGHAEHYANADPALPFAFRMLSASMAQPELFSYLMENLVNDPAWLERYLGLAPDDARFVAYRAALSDLMLFRRYCAKYISTSTPTPPRAATAPRSTRAICAATPASPTRPRCGSTTAMAASTRPTTCAPGSAMPRWSRRCARATAPSGGPIRGRARTYARCGGAACGPRSRTSCASSAPHHGTPRRWPAITRGGWRDSRK